MAQMMKPRTRTKYYEPDRCICDGRPVRFESHLCVHICSSAEPELIKNAQNRERQSAQHKNNFFEAVVPDDRCVVHDFRIATKQLIAPPVDENASAQGKKQRNGECDAERGTPAGSMARRKADVFILTLQGGEKLGFEPAEMFLG